MGVDELQAVVDDDALGCKQAMHLGVLGRIERHEIIGHDASAAINHTMLAQGVILQRVGQMDAVLVGELAVLVAVVEIHGIILALALLVRLLDASAARRIVMGYGETYLATILKGKRTLHQSLAKSATTYDNASVLVLYGTRHNFGCRSRELVGENHELALAPASVGLSTELLSRRCTAIGVDDEVAFLQKLVGYLGCRLKIASTIVLKVEDEVFHAFLLERVHSDRNLLVAGHSEAAQTDVSDSGANHIGCIHRGDWYLVALDTEGKLVLDATAHNSEVDYGSLGSAKALHDFFLAHLDACDGCVVDCHNAVAGYDAHFLGRPVDNGLNDEE